MGPAAQLLDELLLPGGGGLLDDHASASAPSPTPTLGWFHWYTGDGVRVGVRLGASPSARWWGARCRAECRAELGGPPPPSPAPPKRGWTPPAPNA
mmetsp:Transcript_77611/g.241024  ORF Transcript_77611/g.241024 Transcript_77611/m.241024 type:complete len:96 (-) Transcript_77611:130-417(-)